MNALMRGAVPALVALSVVAGWASGTAQAQVVVGARAMPAPIVEVVPAPRAGFAWVPGHWTWRLGLGQGPSRPRGQGRGDAGTDCRSRNRASVTPPCLGQGSPRLRGWTLGLAARRLGPLTSF